MADHESGTQQWIFDQGCDGKPGYTPLPRTTEAWHRATRSRGRDNGATRVRDVMTRDVEVIHPNTTIREAADKMRLLDIGVLPVHDGTEIVGVLTDRDIAVRAVASGLDPESVRARQAMTKDVVCCREDQEIEEAVALMRQMQLRRLPVLDAQHRLVGLVSLGDLAVLLNDPRTAGELLCEVSKPAHIAKHGTVDQGRWWAPPEWW